MFTSKRCLALISYIILCAKISQKGGEGWGINKHTEDAAVNTELVFQICLFVRFLVTLKFADACKLVNICL